MEKIRLLLSALAGLVACAAGIALLWFELVVWDKGRPKVMGIGAVLALGGAAWALNRVMVAFGALEDDKSESPRKPDGPGDTRG
jgi:hypothetical protein